ncbi:MAG: GNAT family N-acetyltransferase [Sphingobacteriales bacterium]|uniref:GNAT family N-acetyltransferase n=1 Tax=Hydrotalea flava TaxID=714549 RepID=UPI00082DED20|nr:GNAT family N-acetyltransferase [Hydrotalea flava]RTL49336.1 MAG: GNAT family N-acetyltransferase [Sphingobacteriales bacterium]
MLTTPRLLLRNWKNNDMEAFIEMNEDRDVMQYFPDILNAEQTKALYQRIQLHFQQNGFGLYAVQEKASGTFIGFSGLMVPSYKAYFTPCVEIGWRLRKQFWGKGYTTEATKLCLLEAFTKLQLKKVYAFTSIHNSASEKVMLKLGMQKEGIFRHPNLPLHHYLSEHVLYSISSNNK